MYFSNIFQNDPFEEIDQIQREMNRLFNNVGRQGRAAYPALNIWNDEESAYITAELPGYDRTDFNATVVGDTLVLSGERKAPELGENENLQRQERILGRFERSIRLPFPVEQNKITAKYQNGVLSMTFPRAEEDKPRQIEIQGS